MKRLIANRWTRTEAEVGIRLKSDAIPSSFGMNWTLKPSACVRRRFRIAASMHERF